MNLKAIRNKHNLSQAKLGTLSGVPLRTIQDIEKRGDCLVSNAILLADALGVTLDELCRTPKKEAVE
ncbi:MAG: helix-turn-helix transcriptional regulator [Oscillospiraceae bacterium]|nr:helix-turn-helix transcriptional regulator [Oscillospiraceae bacterium]